VEKPRAPYVHRLESVSSAALRLWQRLEPEVWGRAPKKTAKKPVVARIAAPKVNGHTTLDIEEQLRLQAARIHAAFNLESKGFTVENLVEGVHQYESPWEGTVQ
jgi:hypothetical protein